MLRKINRKSLERLKVALSIRFNHPYYYNVNIVKHSIAIKRMQCIVRNTMPHGLFAMASTFIGLLKRFSMQLSFAHDFLRNTQSSRTLRFYSCHFLPHKNERFAGVNVALLVCSYFKSGMNNWSRWTQNEISVSECIMEQFQFIWFVTLTVTRRHSKTDFFSVHD